MMMYNAPPFPCIVGASHPMYQGTDSNACDTNITPPTLIAFFKAISIIRLSPACQRLAADNSYHSLPMFGNWPASGAA